MKSNEQLQQDIEDALKWEPLLHAAEIGVTVKNGVVTLTGTVDNYLKKNEAEAAAKHVSGVKAVVEHINVKFAHSLIKSDEGIAAAVATKLASCGYVPEDRLDVKVEDGKVYLSGNVQWHYQRIGVETAIKSIPGIKAIFNLVSIKNEVQDEVDRYKILDALQRHWLLNSEKITVLVNNGEVTLQGSVPTLYEKEESEKAVWKAPGVWHVDNQLEVGH